MAEQKSFRSRLGQLFSSSVVVRKIGKDKLRVIDSGHLQSSGNTSNSRYIDRYQRLHGTSGRNKYSVNTYSPAYNYFSSKVELYSDYECISGDTIIPTLEFGLTKTMKELSELYPTMDTKFHVYSFDNDSKSIQIGMGHSVRKTKTAQTYKIVFDDGKELIATPDHPVLLRSSEYCLVKDLKVGDSVMPFYSKDFYGHGYNHIYTLNKDKNAWNGWKPIHVLVAEQYQRPLNKGEVVHHKDFNKHNNLPDNLCIMTKSEHSHFHRILTNKNILWSSENRDEHIQKIRTGCHNFLSSEKGKIYLESRRGKRKGINNPFYGKTHSNESNLKRSISLKKSAMERIPSFKIKLEEIKNVCKEYYKLNGKLELAPIADQLNITRIVLGRRIKNFGYKNWEELKYEIISTLNHKIVSIEPYKIIDVYDMTVDKYHNFATDTCFVHNCMEQDALVASVLDIYADSVILKDDFGDILRITSDNENVKKILDNLFYDILNIEFNLWPWTRNLCKYGDFYLFLDIQEGIGIVNAEPLSSYEIIREEGLDGKDPYHVEFKQIGGGNITYQNYEMAHFRLLTDANFLPYGKSILEPSRKTWKQLTLMEDAMLIHRIMRAPEKRIFKIDVGNIPPNEVDNHMQRIINQMRKVPYIDEQTGEYNLKFNMQNMLEDYFLPVRGGQSGTEIDTLSGMEFTGIEDIEYLKDKVCAGFKVPKAFLGYAENLGGKATLAAEDARFAQTAERVQRIILSELYKIAIIHLYSQGFENAELVNFELSMTTPSTIYEQEKLTLYTTKVDLAGSMMEKKLLPTYWMYKNIFNFSDTEIDEIQNGLIEDQKNAYRMTQISEQGEDPAAIAENDAEQAAEEGGEPGAEGEAPTEAGGENPFVGKETSPEQGKKGEKPKEEGIDHSLLKKYDQRNQPKKRKTPEVPKGGWPGAGRPKEGIKYNTHEHPRGYDPVGHVAWKNSRTLSSESIKKYGLDKLVKKEILKENQSLLDDKNIIPEEN